MVMVAARLLRILLGALHILLRGLLDVREILLGRLQISRLQVLPQLGEFLHQRIRAGLAGSRRARRAACGSGRRAARRAAGLGQNRKILGYGRIVLLGLRQIARLQILRQLLEFTAGLLKLGLASL